MWGLALFENTGPFMLHSEAAPTNLAICIWHLPHSLTNLLNQSYPSKKIMIQSINCGDIYLHLRTAAMWLSKFNSFSIEVRRLVLLGHHGGLLDYLIKWRLNDWRAESNAFHFWKMRVERAWITCLSGNVQLAANAFSSLSTTIVQLFKTIYQI